MKSYLPHLKRMLFILIALMACGYTWADKKTATWNATKYNRSTDITTLSSNDISVSLTNICTSSERTDSKRNFQCKDGTQASFTVTAPNGYLVRSIRIYDDFKDGRDLTSKNDDYGVDTSSDNQCVVSIKSDKRESKSLTVDCYKGGDGTNFRYLEVVCVKDVSISFNQGTSKTMYTHDAPFKLSVNMNGHDGSAPISQDNSTSHSYISETDGLLHPGYYAGSSTYTAVAPGTDNYARSNTAKFTVTVNLEPVTFQFKSTPAYYYLTNGQTTHYAFAEVEYTVTTGSGVDKFGTANTSSTNSDIIRATQVAYSDKHVVRLWHNKVNGKVTITFSSAQDLGFKASNTLSFDAYVVQTDADGTMPIGNLEDWKVFNDLVKNHGYDSLNVRLTADIDVGDNVFALGTKDKPYRGIIDGAGHTLTFNASNNKNVIEYGKNVTVKDLTINGTVKSKYVSGFMYWTYGNITFQRCVSNLTIDTPSTLENTAFLYCTDGGNVVFEDCIDNTTFTNSKSWKAFAGTKNKGTFTFRHCLCTSESVSEYRSNTTITVENSFSTHYAGQTNLPVATEAQLKSGEIAYKLQDNRTDQMWGQKIGTDAIPVFSSTAAKVYQGPGYCDGTGASYSNSATEFPAPMHVGDSYNDKGLCVNGCGAYQPAPLVDGVYQISNAGQLAWFSDYVNTANAEPYNRASAKLMNDIDLSPVCYSGKNWVPIAKAGVYAYENPWYGNFEGDNHKITGLYIYNDEKTQENYQAFIGFSGGKIQNLYLDGNVTIFDSGAAILVEYENQAGEITNCHVSGTLAGKQFIGAIAANADGRVSKCTSSVKIDTYYNGYIVGGIVGDVFRGATITECVFTGEISSTAVVSKYNKPTIGGIVGDIGGRATLSYCLNNSTMNVKDGRIGAIAGNVIQATISNNLNLTTSMTSDYTHQAIAGSPGDGTYSNNYYLKTDKLTGDNGTAVTAAQLASGEVAYLLNASQDAGIWKQTLTSDAVPTLDSTHGDIYGAESCDPSKVVYVNAISTDEEAPKPHGGDYDENGICSRCGAYQPADLKDGWYEIANVGQMAWFRDYVNAGNTTINARLTADIDLSPVCHSWDGESEVNWTPISEYNGTFDGQGHAIQNLYINTTEREQALFGSTYGGSLKLCNFTLTGSVKGSEYSAAILTHITHSFTIENVINYANVTSYTNSDIGGFIGYASMSDVHKGKIINCANYGRIEALENNNGWGGVGGFCGYTSTGVTLYNCYNVGKVVSPGKYHEGITGRTLRKPENVNCATLDTSSDTVAEGGKTFTLEEFMNGTVAYHLNNSTTSADNPWRQTLGEDKYPVLDKTHALVYAVEGGYANKADGEAFVPVITIPGDANGDGSVTITDALAVVYHVLNKTVDNFDEKAADMDASGDISITDALAIVKTVLGGNSAEAKKVSDELEDMLDPQ